MTWTRLLPADESIPAGELEDLRAIARVIENILDTARRPARRGRRPMQHGSVRAEFVAGPDVPDNLREPIARHTGRIERLAERPRIDRTPLL